MTRLLRTNCLSIVLVGLFLLTFAGQYVTGWYDHTDEQRKHGLAQTSFTGYVAEAHFLEATFENWESEFLQMAAFVVLTIFLFQKGSAESKDPYKKERVDEIKKASRNDPTMPWPVRRGGLALVLYSNSLSILFGLSFLASFLLHGIGGAAHYSSEQHEHGGPAATVVDYMTSSTFWFESFQNWQSEFLSIAAMVIFTIFLRQKGSPESKPVDSPHGQTGTE